MQSAPVQIMGSMCKQNFTLWPKNIGNAVTKLLLASTLLPRFSVRLFSLSNKSAIFLPVHFLHGCGRTLLVLLPPGTWEPLLQ